MKFQIIWAHMHDGVRYCVFVRPASFNVEAWVKERAASLHLLGIVGISVEETVVSTEKEAS